MKIRTPTPTITLDIPQNISDCEQIPPPQKKGAFHCGKYAPPKITSSWKIITPIQVPMGGLFMFMYITLNMCAVGIMKQLKYPRPNHL